MIEPIFSALPFASAAALPGAGEEAGCTFETVTQAEKRRYRSRYRRRVRIDGQEYADAWLREQVCPTQEQQASKEQRLTGKDGKSLQAHADGDARHARIRRRDDHDTSDRVRRLTRLSCSGPDGTNDH